MSDSDARLPLIAPADLSADQRPLYDDMSRGIASGFNGFTVVREDGALMGPWNISLHYPAIGKASWDLTKAIYAMSSVSARAKEVAILVVGSRFNAAYELYAHTAVATSIGMSQRRLSSLAAGLRPDDLGEDESVAFDVAYALCRGGALPQAIYNAAIAVFGDVGAAELIFTVSVYCWLSMTLNAYDVPVPTQTDPVLIHAADALKA